VPSADRRLRRTTRPAIMATQTKRLAVFRHSRVVQMRLRVHSRSTCQLCLGIESRGSHRSMPRDTAGPRGTYSIAWSRNRKLFAATSGIQRPAPMADSRSAPEASASVQSSISKHAHEAFITRRSVTDDRRVVRIEVRQVCGNLLILLSRTRSSAVVTTSFRIKAVTFRKAP